MPKMTTLSQKNANATARLRGREPSNTPPTTNHNASTTIQNPARSAYQSTAPLPSYCIGICSGRSLAVVSM